jgi:sensor histidine kinase YesM
MKTRGLIDLYLPSRLAYHLKIILASLTIAILFTQFRFGRLWGEESIHLVTLLFVQLELFIWLGTKFFNFKVSVSTKKYVKKVIVRLILFYILAFFLSAIIYLGYSFSIYVIEGYELNQLLPNVLRTESSGFLIGASIGWLFGAAIFFYFQWMDALKREQKLREEQLIFQYETLKSQVNPHFLFNSLNTLSSLVYKDPELSDEFIGKLSSIYRYILENVDVELVKLSREIEFVRKYFELQQVRDNGKIDLRIDVNEPDDFNILPISLQLLMENAFKHNAATREKPLKMEISLNRSDQVIEFRNNFQPKLQIEGSSGIGLKNLAERMKLTLHRELEVVKSTEIFLVKVPIKQVKNESSDH